MEKDGIKTIFLSRDFTAAAKLKGNLTTALQGFGSQTMLIASFLNLF